jgi:hypothetical protein
MGKREVPVLIKDSRKAGGPVSNSAFGLLYALSPLELILYCGRFLLITFFVRLTR